jgi:hypothetical protein
VSDIFEEIDEELRAERAKRLLQKYGGVLMAAAVLVVVAVGGWQAWKTHQSRETARIGQTFLAALDGAAGPAGPARQEAEARLQQVIQEGGAGYRTAARLRLAALKADSGDRAAATALYNQVAGDPQADPLLRDGATLVSVQRELDSGEPVALLDRLKPLTAPANPWHALAAEEIALLDIRAGKIDDAKAALKALGQDVTAPEGVRGRAGALLAQLGG